MDQESLSMIITLLARLLNARMALKLIEFETQLLSDKKLDKKNETNTLIAGYKKALEDMHKELMSVGEM